MSKAPSMPLFCGDYLSDTKHLTLEQHGAYLVLLMVTWRNNGQAIKDDADLIARYLGCTRDRWLKKIRPILEPMFDLEHGTWRSHKLEHQWAFVQNAIAAKRENGKKGGRPPATKMPETEGNRSNDTLGIIETVSHGKVLNLNDSAKAVGSVSVKLEKPNHPQPLPQTNNIISPLPPSGGGESHGELGLFPNMPDTPAKPTRQRKVVRFTEKQLEPFYEQFAAAYPKGNKTFVFDSAKDWIKKIVNDAKEAVDPMTLVAAAMRYQQSESANGNIGTQYVMKPNNWLRTGEWKAYDNVHRLPVNNQQYNNHHQQRQPRAAGRIV